MTSRSWADSCHCNGGGFCAFECACLSGPASGAMALQPCLSNVELWGLT